MSQPPDPSNPYAHNPYQQPPPQQQPPGYGYPQQPPPGGPPGYGYPQQQYPPGMPGMPGMGMPGMPVRMPGQVVTARVLLFIAGSLWALFGILLLIVGLTAGSMSDEFHLAGGGAHMATGLAIVGFVVGGGLSALHFIPASMFGKGGPGTRITAIIASAVNSLVGVLALFSSGAGNGGSPVVGLLWAATAILTLVFCCLRQASEWFNRPRY